MEETKVAVENQLEKAGEKMGQLMMKASEKEKEILRGMKKEVEDFAVEEEKKGKYYDKSALFAAGIIANPEISDDDLKNAAKEYIEIDHKFIRLMKEEEEKA